MRVTDAMEQLALVLEKAAELMNSVLAEDKFTTVIE